MPSARAEGSLEQARGVLCCGGGHRRRHCRPEVELIDLRIHSTSRLPVSSVGAARTRRGRLSARIREQELPARPWHSNGAGQAAATGAPSSAMAFAAALMDKGRGSGLRPEGAAEAEPMEPELAHAMAGAVHVEVRHHRQHSHHRATCSHHRPPHNAPRSWDRPTPRDAC